MGFRNGVKIQWKCWNNVWHVDFSRENTHNLHRLLQVFMPLQGFRTSSGFPMDLASFFHEDISHPDKLSFGIFFLKIFFILCAPLKKKKNGYWISYNTASMFCFYGHEACGILAARPGTEPTPPALEGDVITTGLLGKSPEIFLFLFSHKIWSLEGDLFLLSAHVLCFVSAQVFHILCSPATWIHRVAKKYCGFPFHTQFPRKNFSWDHCLNKSWLFK